MRTIKRSCSNRINTRALKAEDKPLVAPLSPGAEDCKVCGKAGQLQASLEADPEAIIVYNQHADAVRLAESLLVSARSFLSISGRIPGAYRACGNITSKVGRTGRWNGFTSKTAGHGSPPWKGRTRCRKCY